MLNYKIPQNPLTNVRREEYSQVNILANHINKEKYLHDKLNEEKLLRKSIIKAMNKENIEIKEKTKHVIEIFKEKLSNAELCIKQYNKKMKLLEKKLNEKHAIKLEKIEPIAVEQLNVPDMKFESPNVLTTTNNYINSNPSTECHETWCTPQSLSSGNLTPIHTPHHTTVKKSTAKKNLYFNNIDNENSDQKLDVRLDTILHHHHHQSPTIHTPLVNQKQSLDEIATLSVAKHKIIELTQLIKKLKSNEISDHNNSNAINHNKSEGNIKKNQKLKFEISENKISTSVCKEQDSLDITCRILELESYNLGQSNLFTSPPMPSSKYVPQSSTNLSNTDEKIPIIMLPGSCNDDVVVNDVNKYVNDVNKYNNTTPVNNNSTSTQNTPLALNITQEMEADIVDIVAGMEVNAYKTQIDELTIQIETLKEESKSRALQSIHRIKELQYEISVQSKALEVAEATINHLQCNINELKHKNTIQYEEYLSLNHKSELELQEMQSMIRNQEDEIEKLTQQINVERKHFLKLKKSLIKLDSLKSSIQSIQSTPIKAETNLPINQITEVYHLGIEQGTKLILQSQEKQCKEQYQEFQNIQKKLREKLTMLQVEQIQLQQHHEVEDQQLHQLQQHPHNEESMNLKVIELTRHLNELQQELEKQITECVLTNQKLLNLQENYSTSDLYQQLTLQAKQCKEYELNIEDLKRKLLEKEKIESIHNNSMQAMKLQYQSRINQLEAQVYELNESLEIYHNNRNLDQAIRTIKELETKNQQLYKEKEILQQEINKKNDPIPCIKIVNDDDNNTLYDSNKLLQERLIQLKQAFHGLFHSTNENDIHCHTDFICKLLTISDTEEGLMKNKISILAPHIIYNSMDYCSTAAPSSSLDRSYFLSNKWDFGISTELKSTLPTLFKTNQSYINSNKNNNDKKKLY